MVKYKDKTVSEWKAVDVQRKPLKDLQKALKTITRMSGSLEAKYTYMRSDTSKGTCPLCEWGFHKDPVFRPHAVISRLVHWSVSDVLVYTDDGPLWAVTVFEAFVLFTVPAFPRRWWARGTLNRSTLLHKETHDPCLFYASSGYFAQNHVALEWAPWSGPFLFFFIANTAIIKAMLEFNSSLILHESVCLL